MTKVVTLRLRGPDEVSRSHSSRFPPLIVKINSVSLPPLPISLPLCRLSLPFSVGRLSLPALRVSAGRV